MNLVKQRVRKNICASHICTSAPNLLPINIFEIKISRYIALIISLRLRWSCNCSNKPGCAGGARYTPTVMMLFPKSFILRKGSGVGQFVIKVMSRYCF